MSAYSGPLSPSSDSTLICSELLSAYSGPMSPDSEIEEGRRLTSEAFPELEVSEIRGEWEKNDTEAAEPVTARRIVPEADGAAHERGINEEGAAPQHTGAGD